MTTQAVKPRNNKHGWLSDFVIVLAVVIIAGAGALVSGGEADPWYQALNKPPFNPPGYLFGIVWPVLYFLMAVSAIIVRRQVSYIEYAPTTFGIFYLQLCFNGAWSFLFFFFHRPLWALIDLTGLWFIIIAMMFHFGKYSKFAAFLLLPYLGWVTFAAYLNGMIVWLN
ncbi:TspO/MBR family protein [Ponticaulis koreensis]|uniref:TspO/MBR family protein n=1 Tax=Ponticaulis koreensis TaxID=1123045 RepID=UPI0003B6B408|nr:TspO/MBR family protein [Ponticaulis koreensis]